MDFLQIFNDKHSNGFLLFIVATHNKKEAHDVSFQLNMIKSVHDSCVA